MSFTNKELEVLAKESETNARLAKNLTTYLRHVSRIVTLKRVLDPKDAGAVGNVKTGNEDSYKAEILRREVELVPIEVYLKQIIENKAKVSVAAKSKEA